MTSQLLTEWDCDHITINSFIVLIARKMHFNTLSNKKDRQTFVSGLAVDCVFPLLEKTQFGTIEVPSM